MLSGACLNPRRTPAPLNSTAPLNPAIRALTDADFAAIQRFLASHTGTALGDSKRQIAAAALAPRLLARAQPDFHSYLRLLATEPAERDLAVDLLTTHETSFFREPAQLAFLRDLAARVRQQRDRRRPFRVWSAACASGEEAWSIAMVLDGELGPDGWQVLGTDVSRRCIDQARRGEYTPIRIRPVPEAQARRHLTVRDGVARVNESLRGNTRFEARNLLDPPPVRRELDAVFIRNVLIYFEPAVRARVVEHACQALRPGGHLFIGRSESIAHLQHGLSDADESIFRLPTVR